MADCPQFHALIYFIHFDNLPSGIKINSNQRCSVATTCRSGLEELHQGDKGSRVRGTRASHQAGGTMPLAWSPANQGAGTFIAPNLADRRTAMPTAARWEKRETRVIIRS